jgi:signal transduction histidine kinase
MHDDAAADSALQKQVVALEAALAERSASLEALQQELDETNRGVVALYAELDNQAEALRRATDLKSRFLAYMSHEFRTPIAAIRSLAQLLLAHADGPLSGEQDKQVRFIESTAAEFAEMVNDLLDLAKVEAGRVDISPAWFEMVDLFSALRGMFRPVLTNPDVTLVFEEPRVSFRLYTDHKKLSQILRNFVSNALKFTLKGEVRVTAQANEDETLTFSVKDDGIGIAHEFHAVIFDDFTQVDSPVQNRLRGTGLGLSLSKRLAELLGGQVALVSEIGRGSTFSVTIPLQLPGAAGPPPTDPLGLAASVAEDS